jgi:hypothetical protein
MNPGSKLDRPRKAPVYGRTPAEKRAADQERKDRWARENPDKFLQIQLTPYGVTVEWYRAQEAKQGGVCAMCHQPETSMRNGKVRRLAVDHNHVTGEARGLLCDTCNVRLGFVEDPKWRAMMDAYLAQYPPDPDLLYLFGPS